MPRQGLVIALDDPFVAIAFLGLDRVGQFVVQAVEDLFLFNDTVRRVLPLRGFLQQ